MENNDDNTINNVYNIPEGVLPVGSSDWEVVKIQHDPEVEEYRTVNSTPHQTNKFLISTLYKPISQLSTLEE